MFKKLLISAAISTALAITTTAVAQQWEHDNESQNQGSYSQDSQRQEQSRQDDRYQQDRNSDQPEGDSLTPSSGRRSADDERASGKLNSESQNDAETDATWDDS